ncbi:hypothetical protein E4J89_19055 [Arthrobacter sp. CAU 1506]|uniref:hypothetical protein n=1 Tax=Arthrobacter sp. CAU 1506 TaxID=2560052 RepID=UPI0010AD7155|nr:hypothetical protein [Arthrobacter sp. CAU 1506]TJY64044.1 hypothetical protein E4J89_19055 [Arthrobacter sp. CAU 1506]
MDTTTVDPRDQTWEVDRPRYRVYFWAGTNSDEWEVSGADIPEVIDWAESNREGRSYTLYACVPVDGLGLVRLAGVDPTAAPRG